MTNKKKTKAGKSEREFPITYFNWEKNMGEGASVEKDESKIGVSTSDFKEYLKAWKKKWMDPEKD